MMYRNAKRLSVLALLLSLMLSSGEGIRLFPIPAANGTAAEVHSGTFSQSSKHRYQYAARSSASPLKQGNSGSFKTKIRHGAGTWAGSARLTEALFPLFHTSLRAAFEWQDLRARTGTRNRPNGRAPPV